MEIKRKFISPTGVLDFKHTPANVEYISQPRPLESCNVSHLKTIRNYILYPLAYTVVSLH